MGLFQVHRFMQIFTKHILYLVPRKFSPRVLIVKEENVVELVYRHFFIHIFVCIVIHIDRLVYHSF